MRWVTRLVGLLALGLAITSASVGAAPSAAPSAAPTDGATSAQPVDVAAARKIDDLIVITIRGEIDAVTSISFRRRLARAEDAGVAGVVVELNTPGGAVGAVLEITEAIKSSNLHTIAWINTQAISGGAIIAIACDEMVIAPGARMGDAGVVLGGLGFTEGLKPTERAKILSPLLAEVVDSARKNGYDEVLVQALVALGVESWHVKNVETGESYFLTEREYTALFGTDPPRTSNPAIASEGVGEVDSAELYQDDGEATPVETLRDDYEPAAPGFTEGMVDGVQQSLDAAGAPLSPRPDFATEDPAKYRLVEWATDGRVVLTLDAPRLRSYGFTDTVVRNDEELRTYVGAQRLARLDRTWSESVVKFMTQGVSGMITRGVLIVVFLLAMFIEFSVPGIGIAGGVALAALAGLVVPPMLINAAAWWTIVAIGLGVVLLVMEIFVIPGTGLAGISGIVLLLAGLVGTVAGVGDVFPGGSGSGMGMAWAASIVLLALFVAGVGAYLFSRYTQHVPIAKHLVLSSPGRSDGTLLEAMGAGIDPEAQLQLGAEGVAQTPLRPAGRAEFDGELVDVVAERGGIEAGTRVRVVSSTRYRVGVEAIGDDREVDA